MRWARSIGLSHGAAVWLLVSALVGCTGEAVEHPAVDQIMADLDHQGDPVHLAARAGDRPVSVEQLEDFWTSHPQLGPDEALDRLIDQKLLVAEARKRGFQPAAEVKLARKRAMVRQLLRERVEAKVTRDDLANEAIEEMIDRVEGEAGHPAGVRASHLVVMVPRDEQKQADKAQVDAWDARARQHLDKMRAELPEEPAAVDLFELRDRYADQMPDPLQVIVNAHLTFPVGDLSKFRGELPDGWQKVVPGFREAASEMARAGRFGEATDPVKTRFGWHVIIAEATFPAQVADTETVRELAQARVLRRERNKRFVEELNVWLEAAEVEAFPTAISEAQELGE